MKKAVILSILFVLIVQTASSTSIESEEILMDLEESRAEVKLNISELTSSKFTYSTGADIQSVNTSEEKYNCRVESQSLGDEIVCDTNLSENFVVQINYRFDGLVEKSESHGNFSYTHPIYRSTESLTMKVKLPERSVLRYGGNISRSISPDYGRITSDGRNIFVEWNEKPSIGNPLSYRIEYESTENDPTNNYLQILAVVAAVAALAPLLYIYWKRINKEDIEELYEELSEDEKKIVEMMIDNEGEMLQKDVVSKSEYSKAKISGLVSELVDKDVVVKEKDGRSNKLRIAKEYRY